MARKTTERYVRYYTFGSTAAKLDRQERKAALPQYKTPEKRKPIPVDPVALVGSAVAVLLAILMLVGFAQNERTDAKQVMESLVTGGELVLLTPQIGWHKDVFAHACQVTKDHFAANETLTLGELRDRLQSSRKYTLALLEYFDKNRITRKEGDLRRLYYGFRE